MLSQRFLNNLLLNIFKTFFLLDTIIYHAPFLIKLFLFMLKFWYYIVWVSNNYCEEIFYSYIKFNHVFITSCCLF